MACAQGLLQLLHFTLAAHEAGQATPSRDLQFGAQRSYAEHFVDVERLFDAFDLRLAQCLERKVALGEFVGVAVTRIDPGVAICSMRAARLVEWPTGT